MVKKHDAGSVNDLEEVFRSQELRRVTGSGSGPITPREDRDDALLRRMFGHASSALRDVHRGDGAGAARLSREQVAPSRALDAGLMSERQTETASSGGGVAAGEKDAAVSAEPPWRRQSGRYRTIAAFSALAALVVAGVTAGTGQHGPSNRSAQRAHRTVRPHSGAASTAPSAPGSLTGAVGSGALALGTKSAGGRGSSNDPGGHVTLGGAATTTGSLPAPSGGSRGASGGSPGATGSGGSNPAAPVAAGVGSTVANVGSSVTGLANQLGSAVPTAVPATSTVSGAVSGVLNSVDQTVDATTL
jgi:hypothetical protein